MGNPETSNPLKVANTLKKRTLKSSSPNNHHENGRNSIKYFSNQKLSES